MSDGARPPLPPLEVAALVALDADDWARVLPHAKRVLREDADADDEARAISRLPTGRLVSGRSREALCRLLVVDRGRQDRLCDLLAEAGVLDELAPRLGAPAEADPGDRRAERAESPDRRRDRERLRRARQERDQARRRADGAEARAERAERESDAQRRRAEALAERLARAEDALADAEQERRRAVERERRRGLADAERLRDQLRAARRELEEATTRLVQARRSTEAAGRSGATSPPEPAAPAVVPGRPTVLPDTVAPGTAEEVDLLLSPGRQVLVDGYNVTKQHRSGWELAAQRDWLVRRLATLAAQRRVRPVVVFDGERASGGRPLLGAREVDVRFSPAGITADDDLVFAVEALEEDEPVLVVTDDRELTERLRRLRADVVRTAPFLWATPS